MNPESLVNSELLNLCSSKKTIVVCGYTKTGKVTIARKLATDLKLPLFISDEYILEHDREGSLYRLIDAITPYHRGRVPIVVEGVLCFRLLRKGLQEGIFFPDMIIKTVCNDATIKYFYEKDGEGPKIPRALAFNKGLNTIWKDYLSLLYGQAHVKKPEYLELETTLPELKYL